jgi:hypothetical protein
LRCKSRLFSVTCKRFLQIFLKFVFYTLVLNNIHYIKKRRTAMPSLADSLI